MTNDKVNPPDSVCKSPYHRPTSIYCLDCIPEGAPLGALLLSNREATPDEIKRGLEIQAWQRPYPTMNSISTNIQNPPDSVMSAEQFYEVWRKKIVYHRVGKMEFKPEEAFHFAEAYADYHASHAPTNPPDSVMAKEPPQIYGRCEKWKESIVRFSQHLNEHPKYNDCKNWKPEVDR